MSEGKTLLSHMSHMSHIKLEESKRKTEQIAKDGVEE